MILAGEVVRAGQGAEGWVRVEGEIIAEVGSGAAPAGAVAARWVTAGLVDLQVNGAAGVEVVDGSAALDRVDEVMLTAGVTSYLPTIITTDDATAAAAVTEIARRARDHASPIAGVHLEGPFLSPEQPGVHPPALLRVPADGVADYFFDAAIRVVTVAPELPGALALVERLATRGVCVSLGHTAADGAQAAAARDRGAAMATHVFNAMPRFHHRAPGIAGWAVGRSDLVLGVVPDAVHLHPDTMSLLRHAGGERVVLVTDASVGAAAPPGTYAQAGIAVTAHPDGTVTTERGAPAGSGITLDEGVRRWISATDAPFAEAVEAASTRPARTIGLAREVVAGAVADLVLWDEDLRVIGVIRRGVRLGP
jgi:N-acetylglucosamine-6-phosphate deacetylase